MDKQKQQEAYKNYVKQKAIYLVSILVNYAVYHERRFGNKLKHCSRRGIKSNPNMVRAIA